MSRLSFTAFATWLRDKPAVADVVLAGGLAGFAVLGRVLSPPGYVSIRDPLLWSCWTLLGLVPVVIRRRWLRAALAGVLALAAASAVTGWTSAESYALLVVTYTVAAHWPLRRALVTAGVLWGLVNALSLSALAFRPVPGPAWLSSPWSAFLLNSALLLVTLLIGRYMYTRRMYEADLRERTRIAESTQHALADQAVADERRRIARELHDVVAHHVSVMGILATGARRSMVSDPAAASAALSTIEETGRTTLRELRRLLDILRSDDEHADLAPQPGLAGVEALVEQLREAGLPVRLQVDGEPYDLDPGIALTIYRIVQEALTNTLKHAGRASALVRLVFADDRLEVEVIDNGRGPAIHPNRTGHGLVGIRERVALYGGRLRLGSRPGGGFRIAATIPMERSGNVTDRE